MKQFRASPRLWTILLFALACLAAAPALAGTCSNPTGNEQEIRYNSDYHTYQFCNGTNWVSVGGTVAAGTVPVFGDPNVELAGDSANGGKVFAVQFPLVTAATVTALSFYVTTAAGTLYLGIYSDLSNKPKSLLATTASFTAVSGWNQQPLVTPVTLAAGNYWLVYQPSSSALAFQKQNNTGPCYYYTHSGALAATFAASPSNCTTTTWSLYAITNLPNCLNPSGNERDIVYSTDYHTYQFCNGQSAWVNMGPSSSGGVTNGTCSSPSDNEREIRYNTDYHTYQFCNGANWTKMEGSVPTGGGPPGSGYFVMSKSTWTGNLGGSLAAADALCLTELTTNTAWKGYTSANANGILNASHVHAFLCDDENSSGTCQQPNVAGKTYYFADANDVTHGGGTMTLDSGGMGPNDSIDWSTADHFGTGYTYWTGGRGFNGTNMNTWWGTGNNDPSYDCGTIGVDFWAHATSGYVSHVAYSNTLLPNGDNMQPVSRWWAYNGHATNGDTTCDQQWHLICYVNP